MVDPVQLATLNPSVDRLWADADPNHLPGGDSPVLQCRQLREAALACMVSIAAAR
jgi:hypothetical protein